MATSVRFTLLQSCSISWKQDSKCIAEGQNCESTCHHYLTVLTGNPSPHGLLSTLDELNLIASVDGEYEVPFIILVVLAAAFAIVKVSSSWAIALIIGPAIGGYLSQPTEKYPKLFPANSFFGRLPYFLPCLCMSFFYFVILISCIWLPETLHMHKLENNEDQANDPLVAHFSDSEEFVKQYSSSISNKSLFRNWPLMSSIVLFCIICFDDMAYSEIFPLWVESNKTYGGLSFSTEDIGSVLVVTGAIILLYQTFIYPHIVKVLGLICTSHVAAIVSMVLLLTYPLMANLSRSWLYFAVNIASVLKNSCVATIITCSRILQNNSVLTESRSKGTANGIATTLISFAKAVAPAGAGIMFSWAQKHQHDFFFPGDQIVFFLLSMVVFLELVWTFKPFLAMAKQSSSGSCH